MFVVFPLCINHAYLTTVSCMHYSLVRLIIAVHADYFLLIRPRIRRWLSFGDGRTLIDLADELCTKCVWFTLLLARMWVLKATTSLFLHRTFINVRTSVVYICDCTLQLSGGWKGLFISLSNAHCKQRISLFLPVKFNTCLHVNHMNQL